MLRVLAVVGLFACVFHAHAQSEPLILFTSQSDEQGSVFVVGMDGTLYQPEQLPPLDTIFDVVISPDGRYWAVTNMEATTPFSEPRGVIYLWEPSTEALHLLSDPEDDSQFPVWNEEGSELIYLRGGGMGAYGGVDRISIPELERSDFSPYGNPGGGEDFIGFPTMDWNSEQELLAVTARFITPPGGLQYLSIVNEFVTVQPIGHNEELYGNAPRFTPDGTSVYFACSAGYEDDPDICLYDLASGEVTVLTTLSENYANPYIVSLDVSSTGMITFTMSLTGGSEKVYIYDPSEDVVTDLTVHIPGQHFNPHWVASGAFAMREVAFTPETPVATPTSAELPPSATPAAFSCGNSLPPILSAGMEVYVVDLRTGGNRLRAEASRFSTLLQQIPVNTQLTVLSGPVCADGVIIFYQVRLPDGRGGLRLTGSGSWFTGNLIRTVKAAALGAGCAPGPGKSCSPRPGCVDRGDGATDEFNG